MSRRGQASITSGWLVCGAADRLMHQGRPVSGVGIVTRKGRDGRYLNPDTTLVQEERAANFAKWALHERMEARRRHLARGERLPQAVPRPEVGLEAAADGVSVTWVGHSTFIVRINGRTVLTDPVWSDRVGMFNVGVGRLTAPGVPWSRLPPVDAVAISHNHFDHLDIPTLRLLPRSTPILTPAGVGPLVKKLGFDEVVEREWWESTRVDGLQFTLTPAQHFSRRGLLDEDRTLWGGWVIESGGHCVYFAGDTGWMDEGFREIGERFPDIDAALMPVGAYLPRWFLRPVHIDPAEAGAAWQATGARVMVPMHWGTFRLADEAMDQPPRDLLRWAHDAGADASAIRIPRLGETLDVASSSS